MLGVKRGPRQGQQTLGAAAAHEPPQPLAPQPFADAAGWECSHLLVSRKVEAQDDPRARRVGLPRAKQVPDLRWPVARGQYQGQHRRKEWCKQRQR